MWWLVGVAAVVVWPASLRVVAVVSLVSQRTRRREADVRLFSFASYLHLLLVVVVHPVVVVVVEAILRNTDSVADPSPIDDASIAAAALSAALAPTAAVVGVASFWTQLPASSGDSRCFDDVQRHDAFHFWRPWSSTR